MISDHGDEEDGDYSDEDENYDHDDEAGKVGGLQLQLGRRGITINDHGDEEDGGRVVMRVVIIMMKNTMEGG